MGAERSGEERRGEGRGGVEGEELGEHLFNAVLHLLGGFILAFGAHLIKGDKTGEAGREHQGAQAQHLDRLHCFHVTRCAVVIRTHLIKGNKSGEARRKYSEVLRRTTTFSAPLIPLCDSRSFCSSRSFAPWSSPDEGQQNR